jgi:hypothetical protein
MQVTGNPGLAPELLVCSGIEGITANRWDDPEWMRFRGFLIADSDHQSVLIDLSVLDGGR